MDGHGLEAALDAYGTYVALAAVAWIALVVPRLAARGYALAGWAVSVALVGLVVLDLYYQYRRVARGG